MRLQVAGASLQCRRVRHPRRTSVKVILVPGSITPAESTLDAPQSTGYWVPPTSTYEGLLNRNFVRPFLILYVVLHFVLVEAPDKDAVRLWLFFVPILSF